MAAGGRDGVDGGYDPGGVCVDGVEQQQSWLTVTGGRPARARPRWRSPSANRTRPRARAHYNRGPHVSVTQAAASVHLRAPADEPIGRREWRHRVDGSDGPAGCAWTGASNNTSWLTVTSGASGSGAGTVAFSASANPNTTARTGTLTIGGQTFKCGRRRPRRAPTRCCRRANRSLRLAAPGRRQ